MSGDNRVKDFFQLTLLCLSFYIVLCLNSFSFSIIFIQQYSDLHHKQQNHSQEGMHFKCMIIIYLFLGRSNISHMNR